MAEKVINSSFMLFNKFGASRQESASKTATNQIRKTLEQKQEQKFYSIPTTIKS